MIFSTGYLYCRYGEFLYNLSSITWNCVWTLKSINKSKFISYGFIWNLTLKKFEVNVMLIKELSPWFVNCTIIYRSYMLWMLLNINFIVFIALFCCHITMQAYMKMYQSDELPEPKSMLLVNKTFDICILTHLFLFFVVNTKDTLGKTYKRHHIVLCLVSNIEYIIKIVRLLAFFKGIKVRMRC